MSETTEINWEDYEAITKYIYESLGAEHGIKVVGYGNKCIVQGKSGVKHQVDVLTEQFDGKQSFRTAIECKYCKQKANKDIVMKLSEIMLDSDIAKGIIVCKSGFTKDTVMYAEHKGIKLVELKEIGEDDADFGKDIEIATLDLHLNVMLYRPIVTRIDLGGKVIVDEMEIMKMHYINMHDADGHVFNFGAVFSAFSKELEYREPLLKTSTVVFLINPPVYWKSGDEVITIEKISMTGYRTEKDLSRTKYFTLTDRVWMMMNELFDKRKLSLSKNGLIWHLS
ncbi:restriction endonuclease [Sphingobacterium olei]|uniref:Restriction endonuclease n=1 Tax=Sphingobacterium olei TaxID=2571155 RepID=A0A4U0NHS3_9SPHI|nr:restriction endonuclease [Sphingobacterium olei]TJZ53791.1 restriction endonuclease [Sphingobacterium olei]